MEFYREADVVLEKILVRVLHSCACVDNALVILFVCVCVCLIARFACCCACSCVESTLAASNNPCQCALRQALGQVLSGSSTNILSALALGVLRPVATLLFSWCLCVCMCVCVNMF